MKDEGANPAVKYGRDKYKTAQLLHKTFKNQRGSANRIKCDIFSYTSLRCAQDKWLKPDGCNI